MACRRSQAPQGNQGALNPTNRGFQGEAFKIQPHLCHPGRFRSQWPTDPFYQKGQGAIGLKVPRNHVLETGIPSRLSDGKELL